MKCEHQSSRLKVWLPVEIRERDIGLKPHPYCSSCGAIKNILQNKPRRLGYYINVISIIAQHHPISQAQTRLVVNELRAIEDFEDQYWMTAPTQQKIFTAILKKYSNISERTIDSFLS